MINRNNLVIIAILVIVNLVAFFWGGYFTLLPFFYIAGFIGISIISFWVGNSLETKDLIVLAVSATLLSFFDEYAHTSVGSLSYFDQLVPSPLTVLGWSIFMIAVIGITRLIANVRFLQLKDSKALRILPVIVSLILVVAVAVLQDFLSLFNWVLVLVYLFLFAASFYYTYVHPLKWNVLLMITGLIFGLGMEYAGGFEGLWTFRFNEPISLLILFSWPLRIWSVNAVCFALDVDFSKNSEKRKIDTAPELDSKKSIMVVADTHFGLKKEKQNCDPQTFSDFLNWIELLEKKGKNELDLGNWGFEKRRMVLKPPEKMIFLGDILELWDTTKESVDVCSRSIIQTLSKLTCEKIYVLGNHDHELSEISGTYPLGRSGISILENEYVTSKGDKKLLFLHGHQFDKLFALPSWRIMPLFNKVANVFGKFTWFFFALFVVNIAMFFSVGSGELASWITIVSLGAISIPFLGVRFGRDFWNSRRTVKYKPEQAEIGLEKWWKKIEIENSKEMNVIYGHTHSIGFWSKNIGKDKLTLFNLPSWVRIQNEKNEIPLDDVFRQGFLYVDDESIEFVGWDTRNKKPFLIPRSVVQERSQGNLTFFRTEEAYKDLLLIGWPPELIDKWSKCSFPDISLA